MCNGKPASDVKVKLYDVDTCEFIRLRHLLASGYADCNTFDGDQRDVASLLHVNIIAKRRYGRVRMYRIDD